MTEIYQEMFKSMAEASGEQHVLKSSPETVFCLGCLAEDTQVHMADGCIKDIRNIRAGDRIAGDGGSVAVSDVITGYEATLIHIQTEGGNVLEATANHPIVTEAGMKQIGELTAEDRVKTDDGSYQKVTDTYQIEYNRRVYNIYAGGSRIICNGLVVGDFEEQNRIAAKKEGNKPSQELLDEMEMLKRLMMQ